MIATVEPLELILEQLSDDLLAAGVANGYALSEIIVDIESVSKSIPWRGPAEVVNVWREGRVIQWVPRREEPGTVTFYARVR